MHRFSATFRSGRNWTNHLKPYLHLYLASSDHFDQTAKVTGITRTNNSMTNTFQSLVATMRLHLSKALWTYVDLLLSIVIGSHGCKKIKIKITALVCTTSVVFYSVTVFATD